MQAGGGLIEYKQFTGRIVRSVLHITGKLEALSLSTGHCINRLSQTNIAQSHLGQWLQGGIFTAAGALLAGLAYVAAEGHQDAADAYNVAEDRVADPAAYESAQKLTAKTSLGGVLAGLAGAGGGYVTGQSEEESDSSSYDAEEEEDEQGEDS